MLPEKHSSTHAVGEACGYVQGESLKPYAAFPWSAYQLPDHQGEMMKFAHTLIVAIIALAGCTKPEEKVAVDPPKPKEIGRWQIVSVGSDVVPQYGRMSYAWRLDTVTGELEMCTYDPGFTPTQTTSTYKNPSVDCVDDPNFNISHPEAAGK